MAYPTGEKRYDPIHLIPPRPTKAGWAKHVAEHNRMILNERELADKRTMIRISPTVYARSYSGRLRYLHLREHNLNLSCPSPRQAELLLQAIRRFVESLDGSLLAEPDRS